MSRLKKPKTPPRDFIAETRELFELAVHATLAETGNGMVVKRCAHKIEDVEDQPTCDLPVLGKASIAQIQAVMDGNPGPSLCAVHWEEAAFKDGGVDTARVYDGSPYASELRALAQAAKTAPKSNLKH